MRPPVHHPGSSPVRRRPAQRPHCERLFDMRRVSRSQARVDGQSVHAFSPLPRALALGGIEHSAKRVKREWEQGVYAELRSRQEQVDTEWLRASHEQWLQPRVNETMEDVR
jgi:hypothetical protein